MTALLTCDGVVAGYGDLAVVRGFDLEVQPGEIVALVGPNGAGKTTTLLTLAGFLPPIAGTVVHRGVVRTRAEPQRAAHHGLVFVPDDRALFPSLTVAEHLRLARGRRGLGEDVIYGWFPRLAERRRVAAGSLSGGEQQMLAIGRAMAQRPDVVLIDELSMGLAPIVVEQLLDLVRQIADTGTAIVLVEQHVQLALAAADRGLVMVHGHVALEGSGASLLADAARLEAAYLGAPSGVG